MSGGLILVQRPITARRPVIDEYHGVQVTDDYRWLENWDDPVVKAWSDAQSAHARAVLARMPGTHAIRKRVTELRSAGVVSYRLVTYRPSTRLGQPGVFFAMKNAPPRQQQLLVTFTDPDNPGAERVLFDPVVLDPRALTSIDWYVPSPDGTLVAASLSEAGSERGNVHVFDVSTGKSVADVVPRVNYGTAGGSLAWVGDSSGFYYTRYPRPGERPDVDLDFFVEVYFHALGTSTEQDRYEVGKEFPQIGEPRISVSPDGQTVLVNVQKGDGGEFSQMLRSPDGTWTRLTTFEDRVVAGYFGPDGSLYLLSRERAPHGKIVRPDGKTVVPERKDAVIQFDFSAADTIVATASRLYVVDQWGGPNHISVFSLSGEPVGVVDLPPVSAVGEMVPLPNDALLIRTTSFLAADSWFHLTPSEAHPDGTSASQTREARVTSALGTPVRRALSSIHPADFSDVEVVRELATSKDGTKVPLSIVRRKRTVLDGANPTLLWGYGGFGISQRPQFLPALKIWLEQGGVFVMAHLRGGGEFGDEWHASGRLTKKQNVFDDFVAAAEHLIEQRYTTRERLAIRGGSNGGLLMGAAMTQRPDLFKAVVAAVGLFDMLRSELEPNGMFNIPEFGTVKDRAQFHALHAYSPYHQVTDGVEYPSILFLTGANDPRVNPMNSRKMTARLQAATGDAGSVLLRTSAAAGHGLGTALSELIEQDVDIYTFLFSQLNMTYQD